jgi:outer membrane protein insertion porin family
MADGDVFSREKITGGLENIRRAYGAVGYINFVAVPDTSFDDENSLVDLEIDIDEGKQFHLASISFLGLDEAARREILQDPALQPGQVYNSGLLEQFLQKQGSTLGSCSSEKRLDEKNATVAVRFDCGQCPLD